MLVASRNRGLVSTFGNSSDLTMPSGEAPATTAFKDWFNPELYRSIAREIGAISRDFDRKAFLDLTLSGLHERTLMQRLRQTAVAYAAAQPGSYRKQLKVLLKLAPRTGQSFAQIWLSEFVALYGLEDREPSLEALRTFTRLGSAEFAIRRFLQRDLAGTLAVMYGWARDPDEHVRRLASEGSRPRLPWGERLGALVRDPSPTAPILEALKADPSLYVRKSVANHLNDIAKDHPDWVLDRVESWDANCPETRWIIRHGLRTLVKRGVPRALAFLGVSARPAAVEVTGFTCQPRRLQLGQPIRFKAELRSTGAEDETLVVDYVVHYVKANGATSSKVFKWAVATIGAGATLKLEKGQTVRDFSTRRHHPGIHRVELQVNGRRLAETAFTLIRG